MAVTKDSVQSLYIAYYGRPADPSGLEYWTNRANAEGLNAVVNAFGNSEEATNLYGNLTIQARVNNLYQNMFGRDADPVGLNFYVGKVLDGTYTLATLAKHILDGVNPNDAESKKDGDAVAKKLAAANAFTAALDTTAEILKYDEATEVTQGVSFLKEITAATTDAEIASKVTTATGALVANSNGQTFTLTDAIDNFAGTAGNDTFLGDNTSANAGDTLNGGAGTDTLKLYNSVSLGNLTSIENVYINGSTGNVNVSSNADVTSLAIDNIAVTDVLPTYTLSATQTLTLQNVTDGDADNTDGVEVAAAASVTAQTLKLNKVGDTATGGLDVNIDINGTGVATLNVDSSTAASRVSIQNSGTAIRTLNISGDAAVEIQANAAANNVGALATAIAITNTAGATVTSSAATNTTAGLTITAAGGADTVTLAQAPGVNALTNKVAVDLGAGDDTLKVTALTAATDIADGASFKGGEGVDTLNIVAGAVLDTTRGKLFSGFETVDLSASTGTFELSKLAGTNTINSLTVAAATAGAVTVNDLAETATVTIKAAIHAGGLVINQKDAGAGSPDDVIAVTFDSKTALTTTGNIDINDIETVNVSVTSTGTDITHTVSSFTADQATKISVNASTAAATIGNLEADALVLFDASASVKAVSVTTGADVFTATSGVAFKLGAGDDTIVLTGANTSAAGAGLDFVVTGNGGSDTITLAAAGGLDQVVYLAQADSTATDFDIVTTFATTEDKIVLKAFGFTGASDDAVISATAAAKGVSVNASGDIEVTAAAAGNFFNDAGIDRAVAVIDDGADSWVFVDVNKDGDFSAAGDLVIKLVGLTGGTVPVVGDFTFA